MGTAVSRQRGCKFCIFTGAIFVDRTMTIRWYLHVLEYETILVYQGAGRKDMTFFQQDDACLLNSECLGRAYYAFLLLYFVESICRAVRILVVLVVTFPRCECLQLFYLGLPQRPCVSLQLAHCQGLASASWSCCWGDHSVDESTKFRDFILKNVKISRKCQQMHYITIKSFYNQSTTTPTCFDLCRSCSSGVHQYLYKT
jgi:hypothetical protein